MSKKSRKIVDARSAENGTIEAARFQGNENFTAVGRATQIVEREGSPNAHVVHPTGRAPFLRTNPDKSENNNLDEMAKK